MCPRNLARRGQTTPQMFGGVVWPLRVDDHDVKPGSLLHSDITIIHGGSQITHHGTIAITCSYKRESTRVSFRSVTEILGPAIIGLQSSTDLKLFICNFTIHENVTHPALIQLARSKPWKRQIVGDQSVFHGVECFNAEERFQCKYHIVLEPSLPPIVDTTRRVTISLKDDISKELDKKCHYKEDRKKGIDTMVQQLCLPPQTERKVEAPPERQRPQCSYSDWTSCHSHHRRDPIKSEGC